MQLITKIELSNGLIGLVAINNDLEELLNQYKSVFNNLPDFNQLKNNKRKCEWLVSRLLIADLIASNFEIDYEESGKPVITHDKYKFISISHSAKYVSVYLHQTKPIGIDVESISRNYKAVQHKYLSDIELSNVGDDKTLKAIYWSCKEAVFKMVKDTGVDFKKQIGIQNFNIADNKPIKCTFISDSAKSLSLQYKLFDDHVMVYTI